jgi:hypothetical protein
MDELRTAAKMEASTRVSSLVKPFVTWEEFLRLPEHPSAGKRYKLHDGEVVLMPPARPLHVKLQKRIERLLDAVVGDCGVAIMSSPTGPCRICNIGLRTSHSSPKRIEMPFRPTITRSTLLP